MRIAFAAFVACLLLGACAQPAKHTAPGEQCGFVIHSLEAKLPGQPELADILEGKPGAILMLSGGSQDGAFGAGFLDGWNRTGTMPRFRLVTGISTGALQSTGAFIGDTDLSVRGYTITGEGDLLDTYVSGDAVHPDLSLRAIAILLKRGAIADLVPLRTRLDELFTDDVLRRVAARYDDTDRRAHLLTGATDVDLGVAVAFDLTEMASRYANTRDPAKKQRFKNCYIEALVASSIVPPAARPVFIDNRMYIDGGVRYAVFDERVGEVFDAMPTAEGAGPVLDPEAAPDPDAPGMYLILNHSGASRAECHKVEPRDCADPASTSGRREDWKVPDLAIRTLELFESQIRRLSVTRAEDRAAATKSPFYFARIREQDLADPRYSFPVPGSGDEAKTCEQWRDVDDEQDNPVEFHRRFMSCLITYGRTRGARGAWDRKPEN